MSTPAQIMPRIEGMLGYQTGSADGGSIQGASTLETWVNLVRVLLQSPDFRYLDDLQFTQSSDVDDDASSGNDLITDATHLIGGVAEMISTVATDSHGWLVYVDADTLTIDLNAALVDTTVAVISIVDVTTTGVSEFTPFLFLAGASDTTSYGKTGIALTTGLSLAFEGNSQGAPAASALRVWTLYRN